MDFEVATLKKDGLIDPDIIPIRKFEIKMERNFITIDLYRPNRYIQLKKKTNA